MTKFSFYTTYANDYFGTIAQNILNILFNFMFMKFIKINNNINKDVKYSTACWLLPVAECY